MHEQSLHRARIVASVAATVISVACGSNYVYSAWAPQYADKLHLSATESNLIGVAGNLGMYTMGMPIGLMIDKGPRPGVIIGGLIMGLGYFPIKTSFDAGAASVPWICFCSYLTGLGGCMAFQASIKTSALNWPHHRGTATAFPLAAFGLSALAFSTVGALFFPGNTSDFLLLLAIGTFGLPFIGFFFLRVIPHTSYHALDGGHGARRNSHTLHRTSTDEGKYQRRGLLDEPGRSPNQTTPSGSGRSQDEEAPHPPDETSALAEDLEANPDSAGRIGNDDDDDDVSSVVSTLPGEIAIQSSVDMDRAHRVDIRGWQLVRNVEFWQSFAIMGILSGIGLMTINNIGHNANALWKYYDKTVDENFLIQHQQMHVSILSGGSFAGRLLSGVGSDYLVKVLHLSRVWCLVVASLIFCLAQVFALTVTNPHFLALVSGLSGLGYGLLFGGFPSIVAESFGVHGLSQNWGILTLSPVITSNIFNIFYGKIFDAHSVVEPNGERSCHEGIECYKAAYMVTLVACGLGLGVTLWTIRHQYVQRRREAASLRGSD